MVDLSIRTPETHPDHHTVGLCFRAWDGFTYFCDSYDPAIGYWMTRVDAPEDRKSDQYSEFRKNVSERAIDRSFHTIHRDYGGYWCTFGKIDPATLLKYRDRGRYSDNISL